MHLVIDNSNLIAGLDNHSSGRSDQVVAMAL
jgi:hypothetical protein